MFALVNISATSPPSIVVETRKPRRVANEQQPEPSVEQVAAFIAVFARPRLWRQRDGGPLGLYNCAGHVWASRRTSILEDEEWNKILSDDRYHRVDETRLAVGDLALYSTVPDGSFLHVAEVVELRQGVSSPVPWVLSRFSVVGEFLHAAVDAPYQDGQWRVDFITMRNG